MDLKALWLLILHYWLAVLLGVDLVVVNTKAVDIIFDASIKSNEDTIIYLLFLVKITSFPNIIAYIDLIIIKISLNTDFVQLFSTHQIASSDDFSRLKGIDMSICLYFWILKWN